MRELSRRLKRWLIVLAALLVVGIAFIWTLPEIVKWQALKQIPAITGRVVAIEDIDINLFTGRVAIKKFRLAEPDPAQAFVEFERLDVRVVPWSSIFGHIRVAELVLTAPTVKLVRVSPTVFNFSDILARLATTAGPPPPPPTEPPAKSRWTIGIERFALIRANLTGTDRAVTPVSEWKVQDLSIEAGNLTTKPSGPVGKLAVHGALNNSPVEFSAQDIDLTPTSFGGKFSIQNFSLLQVRPYLPPTLPASLESGIAGITMALKLELGKGGLAVGLITGDLTLTSLALAQPGKPVPFLTVPRIAVGLKEVNLVSRVVTISSVDIEGLDLKAVRDKQEQIDLLELTKKPEAARRLAGGVPRSRRPPLPVHPLARSGQGRAGVQDHGREGHAEGRSDVHRRGDIDAAHGAEAEQPRRAGRRRDLAEHPAHEARGRGGPARWREGQREGGGEDRAARPDPDAHHPQRADRAVSRVLSVSGELLGPVQLGQPEPGAHHQRQADRALSRQ